MKLHEHGPSLTAAGRLLKARESGDATAIKKGEIDLVAALADYARTARPGLGNAELENAVIALTRTILAALQSSELPYQSGSPFGMNKRYVKSTDIFGEDTDPITASINAKLLDSARKGLDVGSGAGYVKDTPQDAPDHDQRGTKLMKAALTPRKPQSLSDV